MPGGAAHLDSLTSLTIGGEVHESLLSFLRKNCRRLNRLDVTRDGNSGDSSDPVSAYDLVRASSQTLTGLSWRQQVVPTPTSLQRFVQEMSNLTRLTYFQLDGPICECCYYALVVDLPPTLETLAFRTHEHDILADLLHGTIFDEEVFGSASEYGPVVPNLKLLVLPKKAKRLLSPEAVDGASKRGITLRFTRVCCTVHSHRTTHSRFLTHSQNRATEQFRPDDLARFLSNALSRGSTGIHYVAILYCKRPREWS